MSLSRSSSVLSARALSTKHRKTVNFKRKAQSGRRIDRVMLHADLFCVDSAALGVGSGV